MSTTSYLQLPLLDVGQREKEATINEAFTEIDTKSLRFLGSAASNPSITGIPLGSTYFNTADAKLKVLLTGGWTNVA
jgi:hypothetical protein